MRGAAWKLGEIHDFSPISRRDNADDCGRFLHLLIGPESPSDIVCFKHLYELRDPLIGILARFTQPDWHIVTLTKINVLLDHTSVWRRPIFVEGIYDIRIERLAED